MLTYIFRKVFGSKNERYMRKLRPRVEAVGALEPRMQALADEDFPRRIGELREQVSNGQDLDELLPEVFAMVREASVRVLGMRHYDVQMIGGMVLHKGKIAEMKTGEGKTLAATLAVVLNALSGRGVHVVTVNDYLAGRDAAWMGRLYSFLGLTTGVIHHGLDDNQRREAYHADITYGTNSEYGFDYLRDNMKFYPEQMVQREHNFAIVDEVDSILIDEARTPLIISGGSEETVGMYRQVDDLVRRLKPEHFTLDEKTRSATLTDAGVQYCERLFKVDNLYDPSNVIIQHHILQSLKAHQAFRRDVDYIVQDDQVVIVDEFTGRLMSGRRYSDGLHQALEAKERVTIAAENQTLASITYQNFFRLYDKLSGMTGTADTEAVEFQQIYGLEVVSIPPHRPVIRKDHPDKIYLTAKEKFNAIAASIAEIHATGQPILVGTISIETSEMLSGMLGAMGIPHNVLNAKQHAKEAEIVAQAGQPGKVTIATNMAGRGTDIVLGEGVAALGGLHILGTERHESRRIDNQLRGRSGRQGDPGSSRFYLSMQDDLMRLFGSDRISGIMEKLGLRDGEAIENPMVTRAVESAQKRVEAHHFDIRKTLLDYDNVMNQQREVIYSLRRDIMQEEDLEPLLDEFLDDLLDTIYPEAEAGKPMDRETAESLRARLRDLFAMDRVLGVDVPPPTREDCVRMVHECLAAHSAKLGDQFVSIVRYFMLNGVDTSWKEHLRNMDALRDGIGLRGYGQKDPKLEYKREGFEMFRDMLFQVRENVFRVLTRLRVEERQEDEAAESSLHKESPGQKESPRHREVPRHKESREDRLTYTGGGDGGEERPPRKSARAVRETPKRGRNDLCPCGSGLKYKKCCGRRI
ncbi:MAG: preprotein translocase subunit SecA [Desulfovibrio sp.]|jgi:preprotein translocase subunit SecA|nr:preprotein translocase subunit SecA [Desulfovibrio sp.]